MAHVFSHLTCAALTDLGRKRKNNEDAFGRYPENGVFCVADGMGGAEDGEVASQAVVEGLAALCDRLNKRGRPYSGAAAQAWIAQALNDVSAWIYTRSEERGTRGTGSTFVGVCFDPAHPGTATALHAGDSRLYLLRKKTLTQVTRDHSAAALAGVKDEKDLNPMFRGIVMRAVGVDERVELERTPFGVAEGDVVLLCSDGLTRMVADKEIVAILRKDGNVEAAARALIDRANHNGGVDNVTVVLIRVGRLPAAETDCAQDLPGTAVPPDKDGERATHDTSRVDTDADGTRPYVFGVVTPSTSVSAEGQPFEQATPTPAESDATPDTAKDTAVEIAETGTSRKKGRRGMIGAAAAGSLCLFVLARQVGWLERNKPTNRMFPAATPAAASPQTSEPVTALRKTTGEAQPQARADEAAKAEAARLAQEKAAREEAERKRADEARLAKARADEAAKAEAARLAQKVAEAAAAKSGLRQTFIRLSEDTAVLERFVTIVACYDNEDMRRTAKGVLAVAQKIARSGQELSEEAFEEELKVFVGGLANVAADNNMSTYLDTEWLPRVSGLTQPEQVQAAERLVKQMEGLIARGKRRGQLATAEARLDLHEVVRMTAECVRQWQEIPGLAPARQ